MNGSQTKTRRLVLPLPDPDATARLATALADCARPGLVVLLDGPVGAGKTTLARKTIQTLLAKTGHFEDVPSPTFTIVQTYETNAFEVWHADLYRLTSTDELAEIGLDTAFDTAFCLVEWPDRLGAQTPEHLHIALSYGIANNAREATITATRTTQPVLENLRQGISI